MTSSQHDLQEASRLLEKQWNMDESLSLLAEEPQELKNKMAAFIKPLLDRDLEKLLALLYRIDLSEDKVRRVLALNDPETLHLDLAEMIIERQLEKIKWRRIYSS